MEDNRYCPLMEESIDDGMCFDIHGVVEALSPDFTAPKKAVEHENRDEICLNCEHHVFD